jgi:hypothetical protein
MQRKDSHTDAPPHRPHTRIRSSRARTRTASEETMISVLIQATHVLPRAGEGLRNIRSRTTSRGRIANTTPASCLAHTIDKTDLQSGWRQLLRTHKHTHARAWRRRSEGARGARPSRWQRKTEDGTRGGRVRKMTAARALFGAARPGRKEQRPQGCLSWSGASQLHPRPARALPVRQWQGHARVQKAVLCARARWCWHSSGVTCAPTCSAFWDSAFRKGGWRASARRNGCSLNDQIIKIKRRDEQVQKSGEGICRAAEDCFGSLAQRSLQ